MSQDRPIPETPNDGLIHLAPTAHRRELLAGRLLTLCGQTARHALPGPSTAQNGFRCPVCYPRLDDYGYLRDP